MKEQERSWFRLDNAAKIFPSVTSDRLTHLFRVAVRLHEPIQPELLLSALQAVVPRFPSFQVRLQPGLFWYSLVENPESPTIYPETTSPCLPFHRKNRSTHLFRVRWFGRRIAVEFSHALTDGMGGATFLRSLVAEYLHLTGREAVDPEDLRRLERTPDPAEAVDDFQSLYDPSFPRFETWDKAFQVPFKLLPKGQYAVTTGRLPLKATLAQAKQSKATLTEFLAATLLASFQEVFLTLPPALRRRARPLRLVLPVNLRPVFHSKTLRNFFVVVPVEIDLRLGPYDFEEIVRKVHHQLQAEMDPKLLKKQIMRNLRGELNPLARLLPLPLKALVLSTVFGSYERQHTASLSNLGRTTWPEPWNQAVHDVEFTPPPSPFCRVNAGVVSYGDSLSVTFGNLSVDSSVERIFFTRLRRLGLPVSIESNRPFLEV